MQSIKLLLPMLVGLVCLFLGHSELASAGKQTLRESFNKIDKYLSETVQSDDIKTNMDAAADWLAKLDKKSKKPFACFRESNTALKEALRHLVALGGLLNPSSCNSKSLEVISTNDMAVGHPRVISCQKGAPTRRVERIVYYYSKNHYDLCYPARKHPKFAQLQPDTLAKVMNLGEKLRYTGTYLSEGNSGTMALMQLMRNQKLVSDIDHVRPIPPEDFDSYIVKPCKNLEQVLGDEFNNKVKRGFPHYDIDENLYLEIVRQRTAWEACQFIVQNQDKIWEDILKFAPSEKVYYAEQGLKFE